jgi:nucleoid DNA-binding protein
MPVKKRIVKKVVAGPKEPETFRPYPRLRNPNIIEPDELAELLSQGLPLPQREINQILATLFEILPEMLAEYNEVELQGLGIFSLIPETEGDTILEEGNDGIPKKFRVSFQPSDNLKAELKKGRSNKKK